MIFESLFPSTGARRPLAVGLALALSWSAAASQSDTASRADSAGSARDVLRFELRRRRPRQLARCGRVRRERRHDRRLGARLQRDHAQHGFQSRSNRMTFRSKARAGGLLFIDAAYTSSILRHMARGTLSISGLTLANGTHTTDTSTSLGGCIYSAANLEVVDSVVTVAQRTPRATMMRAAARSTFPET